MLGGKDRGVVAPLQPSIVGSEIEERGIYSISFPFSTSTLGRLRLVIIPVTSLITIREKVAGVSESDG